MSVIKNDNRRSERLKMGDLCPFWRRARSESAKNTAG